MKIFALPLLVLCVLALGSCGKSDGRSDPYQVYATLLRQDIRKPSSYLVVAETEAWKNAPDEEVRKQLVGLRQDTVDDFLLKNKESVTLGNEFPKDLNVVLVPDNQIHKILAADEVKGWAVLRTRYPGTIGMHRFSRVGFSKDGTQALLGGSGQSDSMGSSGGFALLNWDGSVWQVAAYAQLWIS